MAEELAFLAFSSTMRCQGDSPVPEAHHLPERLRFGVFELDFRPLTLLIISFCSCLLAACGGGNATGVKASATHLAVTASSTVTAGITFSITVQALDASNNIVATYAGVVHFSSSDAQALLPANSTLTNGVGSFSVALNTAGSQTITATDTITGSVTGTSSGIAVTAGAATHFSVTAPPNVTAGSAFSFSVTALDVSNNTATTYTGTVKFSTTDNQAGIPANSTLKNGTGTFSATLRSIGNQTITATDTVTATITGTSNSIAIKAPPASDVIIAAGTPPNGTVGVVYNVKFVSCTPGSPGCFCRLTMCEKRTAEFTFAATGGTPPYTWTWTPAAGSSLPPGLSLSGKGVLSGTPTTAGTYNVIVTVQDSATPPAQSSGNYAIAIAPPPPPVIDTNLGPYSPVIGIPYSFTFSATGGQAPLTWTETGQLPPGLSFSSAGVLSGTPTKTGPFPIVVTVQDSAGQSSAPADFNLQVFLHGFQPTGNMTAGRFLHTATLLSDGRVLITGGADGFGDSLQSAELFDAASGTFTATGSMSTGRSNHTAALLGSGKVLVAGGGSATAELFDPASGTFSLTGSMETSRSAATSTPLNSGKVLVAGGGDVNGTALATAELYDPATGAFIPTGKLIAARSSHTATLLSNGKVLLTGGQDANGQALATAEIFDPASGSFTATGAMTTARFSHTATLLTDGKVLLTGGIDATNNTVATAELFDPSTGTFAPTGSMETARSLHTATLLNDGTVLIAGPDQTAELFDPASGTFAATGSMTIARQWHTATLLANGAVLVTGGQTVNIDSVAVAAASAELYQ